MAEIDYRQGCREKLFTVDAQNARPKASLKWFLGILAERNFGAINAITTLVWTNSSAQDTIIYEF
jgi:hypothetical protein